MNGNRGKYLRLSDETQSTGKTTIFKYIKGSYVQFLTRENDISTDNRGKWERYAGYSPDPIHKS